VKPTCINRAAVQGLLRHVRPRELHIVTSTARQCVAFRSWGASVSCHVQVQRRALSAVPPERCCG
jgi:hypothetical protein